MFLIFTKLKHLTNLTLYRATLFVFCNRNAATIYHFVTNHGFPSTISPSTAVFPLCLFPSPQVSCTLFLQVSCK